MLEVVFEQVPVPDLRARKARSQHVARMLPLGPVGGEDAISEEWLQPLFPLLANAVRFEIGGEDGFDVFRVHGEQDMQVKLFCPEGRTAEMAKFCLVLLEGGVLIEGLEVISNHIDAERVFSWPSFGGRATMLADELLVVLPLLEHAIDDKQDQKPGGYLQ